MNVLADALVEEATRRWAGPIDLTLAGAGEPYALTPDVPELARHGHFTSPGRPWQTIRDLQGRPPSAPACILLVSDNPSLRGGLYAHPT